MLPVFVSLLLFAGHSGLRLSVGQVNVSPALLLQELSYTVPVLHGIILHYPVVGPVTWDTEVPIGLVY